MTALTTADLGARRPRLLFDVDNLPYGVFSPAGEAAPGRRADRRPRARPGAVAAAGEPGRSRRLAEPSLNPLMALGPAAWAAVRALGGRPAHRRDRGASSSSRPAPLDEVTLHLPVEVADYVDFYASLDHATNVGRIFRPDAEPLTARTGGTCRSATTAGPARSWSPVRRSSGRAASARRPPRRPRRSARAGASTSRPSSASSSARPSELGSRVPSPASPTTSSASTGLNDWSARDIQAWEYVPLGPFLGKSFATSISPWVTPLAALDAAWVDLPGQDPEPLPYLAGRDPRARHRRRGGAERRGRQPAAVPRDVLVAGPDARPPDRQRRLAAHRRPVRAPARSAARSPDQRGSFLELSWGGTRAVRRRRRSAPSSRTATRWSSATRRPAARTRAWDWARCVARSCPRPDLPGQAAPTSAGDAR